MSREQTLPPQGWPPCAVCYEAAHSGMVNVLGRYVHSGCVADATMPIVRAAANLVDGWYAVGSENEGKLYAAVADWRTPPDA